MAVDERTLTAGLDALEVPVAPRVSRARRIFRSTWPKLLAIAIVWGIWQLLYWTEWRPHYALPSPDEAVRSIFDNWSVISTAIRNTLRARSTATHSRWSSAPRSERSWLATRCCELRSGR